MSYSDYWRVNKSSLDYIELANVIRSVRKVIGCMRINADVVWRGMPTDTGVMVELPSYLAQGTYPIPGKTMDVITGFAIHNAMHIKEHSRQVRRNVSLLFPKMEDKRLFHLLVDTGEDIHVDGITAMAGITGKYVQQAREWWNERAGLDFIGPPHPERLLGLWAHMILDIIFSTMTGDTLTCLEKVVSVSASKKESSEGIDIETLIEALSNSGATKLSLYGEVLSMSEAYLEPLGLLLSKTEEIVNGDFASRILCYTELWNRLGATFSDWLVDLDEAKSSEELLSTHPYIFGGGGPGGELPTDLANAVEEALAKEAEDITIQIEAALSSLKGGNEAKYLLYPAVWEVSCEPSEVHPDQALVHKLRNILRAQKEAATRMNRGLVSGKLDAQKLYRAYTTGRTFKRKEYFPMLNQWTIVMLLDASGSMEGKWGMVGRCCSALAEALGEYNTVRVYAYSQTYRETINICILTDLLHDGGHLCTITPGGCTPTGEALIATALKMPQGNNRRLILHLTDGLWNSGVDVWYGLEFCAKKQIEVITLGYGSSSRRAFELQYGNNFEMIDSLEELPHVVESLLRRKLLGFPNLMDFQRVMEQIGVAERAIELPGFTIVGGAQV